MRWYRKPNLINLETKALSRSMMSATLIALTLTLRVVSAEAKPLMMVSDIDDTIKRTNVLSSRGILFNGPRTRNSFKGMSDLYVAWACDTVSKAELDRCLMRQAMTRNNDRLVTYVTAAKGKLQMFGNLFLKNSGFPVGLFIGREESETDVAETFARERVESEAYPQTLEFKVATIKKLIADYRDRDFVLVGDNGEKDVAAYAAVAQWAAKAYPGMRVHTFIHQVYHWKDGVAPRADQDIYVTAGDLGLELYRRGLLSESALVRALDGTLNALKANDEDVFPPFLDCRPMLASNRFPTIPDGLSPVTQTRVEHLLTVLKKYCSRAAFR